MDCSENVIIYNQNDKTLSINGSCVTGVTSYCLEKVGESRYRAIIFIDNAVLEYKDKSRFDGVYYSKYIKDGSSIVSHSIPAEVFSSCSKE